MNIKKVAKQLANARDGIKENGGMTPETREALQALIQNPMPRPENDNTPLTSEQKFRLRLMEKTGTGSTSIH
tara:strand:- start:187 stop:402 length:216 start_codon:yes stop_codon:yes gene_type:complete